MPRSCWALATCWSLAVTTDSHSRSAHLPRATAAALAASSPASTPGVLPPTPRRRRRGTLLPAARPAHSPGTPARGSAAFTGRYARRVPCDHARPPAFTLARSE